MNQGDLGQEFQQTRADRAQDQNLAREGDAPGEPGVLGKDVGAGVERLEDAVPHEVAAQDECPVVPQWNTHHMAEDQDENRYGE